MTSYFTAPNFVVLDSKHPADRWVGPLIAFDHTADLDVCGTAFLIAEGWGMTAGHVLLDYLEKIGGHNVDLPRPGGPHFFKSDFVMRLQVTGGEGRTLHFGVTVAYSNIETDIALLKLKIEEGRNWSEVGAFPTLQLLPPIVGEKISVAGCPESFLTIEDGLSCINTFPRLATGEVREIYEQRRDRILNFPCFRMTARVRGRMSGSPVFNEVGHICGVAVCSMQQDDSEEPISYGASLWAAAPIAVSREPPLKNAGARFYDVMRRGQVHAIDLGRIRVALYRKTNSVYTFIDPPDSVQFIVIGGGTATK